MNGILDLLTGKETDSFLLYQQDFSCRYQLTSKNCFLMEKNYPPVNVSAKSTINLRQVVDRKNIMTRIAVAEYASESDHEVTNKVLQDLHPYTKINPVTTVNRKNTGTIKGIANMLDMWEKWEIWKNGQLPAIEPNERKQKLIIKNYENGLKLFEENFTKNLQNVLLLPECYRFTKDNHAESGTVHTHYSRFIEKLELLYWLEKETFTDDETIVKLTLRTLSDVNEKEKEELISAYYELYYPEFSFEDYKFEIVVEYTFDKFTSAIINGKLHLTEQIHPDFVFTTIMELAKTIV